MTEDELSHKLGKLEITPLRRSLQLADMLSPITTNPFFYDTSGIKCPLSKQYKNEEIYGKEECLYKHLLQPVATICNVHVNFCPDNVWNVESLKSTSLNSLSSDTDASLLTRPIRVGKRALKKRIHTKFVLREPILRALQTCLQIQSTARRKKITTNSPFRECGFCVNHYFDCYKKATDFPDLITECQIMLQENVTYNGNTSIFFKNFGKFTTMPGSGVRKNVFLTLNGSKLQDTISCVTSNCCINRKTSSRASISCSQKSVFTDQCEHSNMLKTQHKDVKDVTDDVTINELASYFDTLVHIPKKMSSMAEMMYI